MFVEKLKLLAYHLKDLRVPQVGNPCLRSSTEIKAFLHSSKEQMALGPFLGIYSSFV